MDIHDYERQYQDALKCMEKSKISERSKALIRDFVGDLILENISKPRLVKYLGTLKILALGLKKDLDQATKEDLKRYVTTIQQSDKFSAWTKQSYKVIIRRFYKWHLQTPGKDYPEIVKWINIAPTS